MPVRLLPLRAAASEMLAEEACTHAAEVPRRHGALTTARVRFAEKAAPQRCVYALIVALLQPMLTHRKWREV